MLATSLFHNGTWGRISPKNLIKISEILGISIEVLLIEQEQNKTNQMEVS